MQNDIRPVTIEYIVQFSGRGLFLEQDVTMCHNGPILKVLLYVHATKQCMTFEMSSCDIPVIIDISLWKSLRPKNRTMISIVTGRILIGIIATSD